MNCASTVRAYSSTLSILHSRKICFQSVVSFWHLLSLAKFNLFHQEFDNLHQFVGYIGRVGRWFRGCVGLLNFGVGLQIFGVDVKNGEGPNFDIGWRGCKIWRVSEVFMGQNQHTQTQSKFSRSNHQRCFIKNGFLKNFAK